MLFKVYFGLNKLLYNRLKNKEIRDKDSLIKPGVRPEYRRMAMCLCAYLFSLLLYPERSAAVEATHDGRPFEVAVTLWPVVQLLAVMRAHCHPGNRYQAPRDCPAYDCVAYHHLDVGALCFDARFSPHAYSSRAVRKTV